MFPYSLDKIVYILLRWSPYRQVNIILYCKDCCGFGYIYTMYVGIKSAAYHWYHLLLHPRCVFWHYIRQYVVYGWFKEGLKIRLHFKQLMVANYWSNENVSYLQWRLLVSTCTFNYMLNNSRSCNYILSLCMIMSDFVYTIGHLILLFCNYQ